MRAPAICPSADCRNRTTGGKCQQCRTQQDTRPSAAARGYGHKWRRTRGRYLSLHPTCEWPNGCDAPATDVHHVDGKGPNSPDGHKHSNLQALCHEHHSQITSHLQPGGWNR